MSNKNFSKQIKPKLGEYKIEQKVILAKNDFNILLKKKKININDLTKKDLLGIMKSNAKTNKTNKEHSEDNLKNLKTISVSRRNQRNYSHLPIYSQNSEKIHQVRTQNNV